MSSIHSSLITLSRILFVVLSCSHDKSVADLVTHGVEVRKLCASCDEEVPLDPNPNPDTKGLGYCEGYGKDATVSGLLVIPTDAETGQTIIPGNIPTSIWGHPTIGKLYMKQGSHVVRTTFKMSEIEAFLKKFYNKTIVYRFNNLFRNTMKSDNIGFKILLI